LCFIKFFYGFTTYMLIWFSHEKFMKILQFLCLGLIGRPFSQDCVFSLNLACVSFGHDAFLA
jgi:hypothetical protein